MTATPSAVQCCPKCGGPIPAEAPQGLCPRCLLAQVSILTEGSGGVAAQPPAMEELARAFPHLEMIELIGQGGMGFVYKARQAKLERFVALKILPHSLAVDPAFTERFTREGRMLARLSHPNIVGVHDFGLASNFFYLLMEYVDGVNLRQAMQAGRFTPEQALSVVPKICEALQYAHNEGVLHRDIKPENILLDARGRVKIADFGIAKLMGEPQSEPALTGSGTTLGTPHYMAPEQIERPSSVDHRADIYSLGVVFYEMLTGELPLGRFAPPSHKCGVDPRVDDVVMRALEKEPGRRSQSATEMKTQLETISAHAATVRMSSTESWAPAPAWVNRVGVLFLILGALAFIPSLLSLQSNSFSFNGATILAFTGIALLIRNELWRVVALFLDALTLVMIAMGLLIFIGLEAGGKLPPNWTMRVGVAGMSNNLLLGSLLAGLELAGWIASVVVLCRQDVKALFAPTYRLAGLPPWASITVVVAGVLALIQGLMMAGGYLTRTVLPPQTAAELATESKRSERVQSNWDSAPSTKTVEFYGVTNDLRSVTVSSHAVLNPDESLTAVVRYPDGRVENALTTFSTIRQTNQRQFYTGLAWQFPESFTSDDVAAAALQVRREKEHRSVQLQDGQRLPMFAITNAAGGGIEGYALYTRVLAETDDTNSPRAVVSFRTVSIIGTSGLIADFSLIQPRGYAVQATASTSAGSRASARTSGGGSQYGWHHHAYWSFESPLTANHVTLAKAQINRLAQSGRVEIQIGAPRMVFAVTNEVGEVCQGWLELVGSPSTQKK